MYFEFWCIIIAFLILQRIQTIPNIWWYNLLFSNFVFAQNIIFYIKGKTEFVIWLSSNSLFFFLSTTLNFSESYPKQLEISNRMCNFLKASLLCKFVTSFMFCCSFNSFEWFFIFFNKHLFFKVHIYSTKVSELRSIGKGKIWPT